MERLLTSLVAAVLLLPVIAAGGDDAPNRQHIVTGIDLSFVDVSGYQSWTEGSVGKLRYDQGSDGLVVSRGYIDYRSTVTDTLNANISVEFYNDEIGALADFTEAYLEWRPVPRSANRYRVKIGAFYPPLSMENTEPGWGSPYTLSFSTINTWVAEELRTFGAELSLTRNLLTSGNKQQVGLHGAIFYANDPAGSLLAWKGWSAHDRQSRLGDKLPLAPLPMIQPGEVFANQDPYVAPFREIDDRAGYYIGGEWRLGKRLLLRAMHYDNRADPTIIKDGQYAWRTKFAHAGAQISLPANIGLLSQWIRGTTVMGPVINGAHMVDTEYDSRYIMLTKVFDKHRLTVRYDNFEVTQNDDTVDDNNPESGHVWTVAYRYRRSEKISLAAEWLSVKTHRCSWEYYDLDPTRTETQLQLTLQLRFSN